MRARNIKPGFFKNEHLAKCSANARLLFIGLWCFSDREGRFEWRPFQMKGEIFPFHNFEIEILLQELLAQELIIKYSVNNKEYGFIPTFKKHQNPHPKEKKSVLPELTEEELRIDNKNKYKASREKECELTSNFIKTQDDKESIIPRLIEGDSQNCNENKYKASREKVRPNPSDILILGYSDILNPEVLAKAKTSQSEAVQLSFLGNAALTVQQEILDCWNAAFATVKGISTTRELTSHDREGVQLLHRIDAAFAQYKPEQIKQAISNYREVITNTAKFWYTQKYTLAQFLYYGIKNGKGFVCFLDEKQPFVVYQRGARNNSGNVPDETEEIRQAFAPVTVNHTVVFDGSKKTFYGYPFEKLDSFESRIRDMSFMISKYGEERYFENVSYLRELELIISGLLFHRKRLEVIGKKEYFETNFKKCMNYWNKYKELFKESAEKMRNND